MAVEKKKHTLSDGTTVFAARNMHKQDIRRSNGNLRYKPQFERNERRQKKNIIKITSYKHKCKLNSILLFFCAQLWPLMRCTTQSEWRFCSAYFGCCLCFFSVDYCIIDWMRCVCCCCFFFARKRTAEIKEINFNDTHSERRNFVVSHFIFLYTEWCAWNSIARCLLWFWT